MCGVLCQSTTAHRIYKLPNWYTYASSRGGGHVLQCPMTADANVNSSLVSAVRSNSVIQFPTSCTDSRPRLAFSSVTPKLYRGRVDIPSASHSAVAAQIKTSQWLTSQRFASCRTLLCFIPLYFFIFYWAFSATYHSSFAAFSTWFCTPRSRSNKFELTCDVNFLIIGQYPIIGITATIRVRQK